MPMEPPPVGLRRAEHAVGEGPIVRHAAIPADVSQISKWRRHDGG